MAALRALISNARYPLIAECPFGLQRVPVRDLRRQVTRNAGHVERHARGGRQVVAVETGDQTWIRWKLAKLENILRNSVHDLVTRDRAARGGAVRAAGQS